MGGLLGDLEMNYSIKAYIKACNETVSSVAERLRLSRPTFDTYINLYETGLPIPKERYQKLFEQLFQEEPLPQSVFKERLIMCTSIIERNMDYEKITYIAKQSDRTSQLFERIHYGVENKILDDDALEFLDLFVSEYSNDYYYNLVQYFLHEDMHRGMDHIIDIRESYSSYYNYLHERWTAEGADNNDLGAKSIDKHYMTLGSERKKRDLDERVSQKDVARRKLYDNKNW